MVAKKSIHIVVVDHDMSVQDLIQAFFVPKGYQVSVFSDSDSALKASDHETWDVLICDLFLPKFLGSTFTERIKRLKPDLPIILMTVPQSANMAVELIQKGAYDFIVKPIHFAQLQISVARALHLKVLSKDIVQLRERVKIGPFQKSLVGKSSKFVAALDIAHRVAPSHANILISGESGTGKELFAQLIHNKSKRPKGPFVAINCSAIPENLLESELFGHAKGAFTGAHEKKIGLFEAAEDGTLFLDEIGDLSLPLQAKLLRVLQERKIKRVGENQVRAINTRIVSATHKNLAQEVKGGFFREDLFFRLNVIPITIPPLRERKEDILPLALTFLKKNALENGSPARSFSKDALKFMLENRWPGNVRELENSVERAVVLATSEQISIEDFLMPVMRVGHEAQSLGERTFVLDCHQSLPGLDEVIQKYISFAVTCNGGAKDRTAKDLGIDRKTLYKKLQPEASATL